MLICSFLPLPPNGFVNLFVLGGKKKKKKKNQQLGKERLPGLYRGGAAPPGTPPFVFSRIFGGAVLGPFWLILGSICAELDHNYMIMLICIGG